MGDNRVYNGEINITREYRSFLEMSWKYTRYGVNHGSIMFIFCIIHEQYVGICLTNSQLYL